jgi:hypothetical protein
MTPTVWSVAMLVAAAAGWLALRTLSKRVRIAFDVGAIPVFWLRTWEAVCVPTDNRCLPAHGFVRVPPCVSPMRRRHAI